MNSHHVYFVVVLQLRINWTELEVFIRLNINKCFLSGDYYGYFCVCWMKAAILMFRVSYFRFICSSDLNNVDRNLYFLQIHRNAGGFFPADALTQLSLHKKKKCGVFKHLFLLLTAVFIDHFSNCGLAACVTVQTLGRNYVSAQSRFASLSPVRDPRF